MNRRGWRYSAALLLTMGLVLAGCDLLSREGKNMLPEISVDMPLQQFLQLESYEADDLILAARHYVQQQVGDQGFVFVAGVSLSLDCVSDLSRLLKG